MSGSSFWVSELIESGNIQIITLKKFSGGGVGWGGGLFDYSVTPGPGLSKVKCMSGTQLCQARWRPGPRSLTIKHFYLSLPLCFLKLQIFEVLSVVKKLVLKRHVVRILFPGNASVNLRSVYFDNDDGRKQCRKKNIVYSTTRLIITAALQLWELNKVDHF